MASRRPTDDADEEDESTALDLGRNIASAVKDAAKNAAKKPTPARPERSSQPAARVKPTPPAAGPLHASEAEEDEDTDYIAVRPPSPRDSRASAERPRVPTPPDPEPDDTEFLAERPTGQSLSLKAMSQQGPEREMRGLSPSKRVVPLGEERSSPRAAIPPHTTPAAAEPPRAPLPRGAHRPIARNEEEDVTEPPQQRAALRGASAPSEDGDVTDAPVSMPRVTRFFVAATPPKKKAREFDVVSQTDPGDDDDDELPPPAPHTQHRPLPARADMSAAPARPVTIIATQGPNPFKRETTLTRSASPTTGAHTAEADSAPADGLLVIEVPEGAVVFVDGEECGRGPQVRVENLHRYARHSIKVHAPGFLRWSGSVSLEGRTAAKVRPALKKK